MSADEYEKDTAVAVVRYNYFLPYCYVLLSYKNTGQFWRMSGVADNKCYEKPLA